MRNGDIDTVLFDLDGTLLDTARDFANALNVVLARHGREALSAATVRPHVSRGGMALVRLGFDAEGAAADGFYDELLAVYAQDLSTHTRLFPGMESLLASIESSARRFGVVTNKPGFLAEPLLRDLALTPRLACLVSGDTLPRKKPFPDPLLHACASIGGEVARTIYVGDDARDIEAGKRAGMRTVAAGYGYILPDDDPHEWGADLVVRHPDEIRELLS